MKVFFSVLIIFIVCSVSAENVYVVNSNSQTLSQIDLAEQQVSNTFAILGQTPGSAPNKIALTQNFAYCVVTYENTVQKVDLASGQVVDSIYLEDSSYPNDIEIVGNYGYVTGNNSYKVYKVDLENEELVSSLEVGKAPQGMAVYNDFLYVANTGFDISTYQYDPGTVSVVDLNNFSIFKTIPTSLNPCEFAVVQDKLHLVCTGNYDDVLGNIEIIDLEEKVVEFTLEIGGCPQAIASDGNKAFIGNAWPAGIYIYDVQNLEVLSTPEENNILGGNALAVQNGYLASIDAKDYVVNSEVFFYDTSSLELMQQYEVGVGASDVKFAIEPSGNGEISVPLVQKLNNYPNPFNPETIISFNLLQPQQVEVAIFNTNGRKIKQLHNSILPSGKHNLIWNGTDKNEKTVASGVYFYQVQTQQGTLSRKMLLVK
ncbi:MAG: T9SS type A sorting domain-containing protein [Candidatus Cloacimonadota bacterium]|nr:T9SS type A sorting domain-containing protein [Candidatus Cloacimonadota bacterium]